MKKLLLICSLFIALGSQAQSTLDTMIIRPAVTMLGRDWCLLRDRLGSSKDSALLKSDRAVHAQIQAINPASFNTSIPLTNMSAKVLWAMYRAFCSLPAKQAAARYTAINSAFAGITQLATRIATKDSLETAEYNRSVTNGSHYYIDQ